MKIMVTGSEGFIGKELVKELRKQRNQVVEFDLSRGQNLLEEKDLELVKGVDAVIHLAALLNEKKSLEELNTVNVKGTEKLLEKCVEFKVKKFVYLSTVGVMGEIETQATELTPFNPKTDYEKSKTEAEKKVNEFQELLPVTIIRSALVLGPNTYWKEIVKLAKGGFPLIGTGKNTFQMVYYKDLVSAIIFCLKNPATENETFIIAEEKGKKLIDVYFSIQKELKVNKKIKLVPVFVARIYALFKRDSIVREEHILRLVRERNYSTEKIRKLGWKPIYNTEKAIKETVKELQALEEN